MKNEYFEEKQYNFLLSWNGHIFRNIAPNNLKLPPINYKFNVDVASVVGWYKKFVES